MIRFRAFTLPVFLIAACGCGGNSASTASTANIVITVSPAKADVDAGGTFVLDFYDTGDTSYGGLSASLAGAGSIVTTGPDFFGEYSAVYSAPGSPTSINSTSLVGTSASITIASKTNGSKNIVVPITLHDNIQFPAQNPPGAFAGVAYNYTFTASGGTGALTYALVNTSTPLPPGLSLSSAGVLSGMPTAVGSYSFLIVVTDQQTKMIGIGRTFTIQVS